MHEATADRPAGDRRSDPVDRRRERAGLLHNRGELSDDQQELHSTAREAILQIVGFRRIRVPGLGVNVSHTTPTSFDL